MSIIERPPPKLIEIAEVEYQYDICFQSEGNRTIPGSLELNVTAARVDILVQQFLEGENNPEALEHLGYPGKLLVRSMRITRVTRAEE